MTGVGSDESLQLAIDGFMALPDPTLVVDDDLRVLHHNRAATGLFAAHNPIEQDFSQRLEVDFSHSLCPQCAQRFLAENEGVKTSG